MANIRIKGTDVSYWGPEDNKTPIGEHPRNKTPYTKKNLTKPKRSPATTPVGDYPGYDYETPAAQAQQAALEAPVANGAARLTEELRKILQAPVDTLNKSQQP
jgi:hypothetical protein